ncbi:MAG: hypothetical protein Q7J25_10585 [Vicinamibacterales bacterium]|nr:hypothetical protein [Vicinamibacterales bacterium]
MHWNRSRFLAIAVWLASGAAWPASAQTVVERASEVRFQLDLKVPASALTPMLPAGWSFNIAPQGPARDANLRVVFIDRVTVNGPDGKPVGTGSSRLVYLIVPVKDGAGAAGQLVIGGITADPADAPGPFGMYLPASTHSMQRSVGGTQAAMRESQDWVFAAATGERLELHVTFEQAVPNRGAPADTRFYSAKNPSVVQIHRQEQMVDILRNVTTNPVDRVKETSFTAGGGSFGKIFDGTEKILSWDNFIWVDRTVLAP